MIRPVILCGGSGTRLWPLSRKALPKQFVPLMGQKSLLQITMERVMGLVNEQHVWVVASSDHRYFIDGIAESASMPYKGILEPASRNTAPAMAAAALNAPPDQLLLFLPADHYVPDADLFVDTVGAGINSAEEGAFVTYGVAPTYPNTGYGYIQVRDSIDIVESVVRFIEKPNMDAAVSYLSSGDYFWNAGIFLVQASALIDSLKRYAPDILEATRLAVENQRMDGNFIHLNEQDFSAIRSESIDYAVLEQHSNIKMVKFKGDWSDVGTWGAVAELAEPDSEGNRVIGQGRSYDTRMTYIHAPYRPVVALGTEDLFIIDTEDAVLVAKGSHLEQVKRVVTDLEQGGIAEATENQRVTRPWGEYNLVDEGCGFKVKRITVKPGASLSLQRHQHRAEHWVVVKGEAIVTCGEKVFSLLENESTFIPLGSKHRLENPREIPLEIIEVQFGAYLGEDDIERFDDRYGRVGQ